MADEKTDRKGRMVYDPELQAMDDVAGSLAGLDPTARGRVVRWAFCRYGLRPLTERPAEVEATDQDWQCES